LETGQHSWYGVWATGGKIRGLSPSRDVGFSPVLKHSPWLWDISSLLYNTYQDFFLLDTEAGA